MATNIVLNVTFATICQHCTAYREVLRCFPKVAPAPEVFHCVIPRNVNTSNCFSRNYSYGIRNEELWLKNATYIVSLPCVRHTLSIPPLTLFNYQNLIGFTVAMAFIIVASLLVNGVIIGTFASTPALRKCTLNFFAINLAVSDLLAAIFLEPIWVVILWNHHYVFRWGNPILDTETSMRVQQVWGNLDLALLVTSLMNIAALSIERCCVVWLPHWYRSHITKRVTYFLLTIPWLYGTFTTVLTWLVAKFRVVKTAFHYRLFGVLTGFGIPTLLIIASYILIFFRVRYKPLSRRRNDTTLALRILSIVILFFVFWSPFFTWYLVAAATRNRKMDQHYPIFAVLKMISYLNALFDPFLYVIVRPPFRASVKKLIRRGRMKFSVIELGKTSRTDLRSRTATFELE